MKKTKETDPGKLYSDNYEYVIGCLMARCPHLRREDAEDIASGAFLEILQKNEAVCCIQNWIWLAKMRAFWHYHTIYERFEPQGLPLDFPSTISEMLLALASRVQSRRNTQDFGISQSRGNNYGLQVTQTGETIPEERR